MEENESRHDRILHVISIHYGKSFATLALTYGLKTDLERTNPGNVRVHLSP